MGAINQPILWTCHEVQEQPAPNMQGNVNDNATGLSYAAYLEEEQSSISWDAVCAACFNTGEQDDNFSSQGKPWDEVMGSILGSFDFSLFDDERLIDHMEQEEEAAPVPTEEDSSTRQLKNKNKKKKKTVQIGSERIMPLKRKKHYFPCRVENCKKYYRKSSRLAAHMRLHAGDEKPYACEWPDCDKKFLRSDELKRHMRVHSGYKPYICETCNKAFSRSDHLSKHQLTHKPKPEATVTQHRHVNRCF